MIPLHKLYIKQKDKDKQHIQHIKYTNIIIIVSEPSTDLEALISKITNAKEASSYYMSSYRSAFDKEFWGIGIIIGNDYI